MVGSSLILAKVAHDIDGWVGHKEDHERADGHHVQRPVPGKKHRMGFTRLCAGFKICFGQGKHISTPNSVPFRKRIRGKGGGGY